MKGGKLGHGSVCVPFELVLFSMITRLCFLPKLFFFSNAGVRSLYSESVSLSQMVIPTNDKRRRWSLFIVVTAVATIIKCVSSSVSRCGHLECSSRRFVCLLPVFIRECGKLTIGLLKGIGAFRSSL